ncbi:MAG: phytanoyl-CoA dioxygenase family protein [Pseudomonadota bacterium]
MLTPQEVEAYQEDGYVIPDFQLDVSIIDEIRDRHDRLLAKHPEFSDYCPSVLAFDLGFLNIGRDSRILDMVEQLIGPDFALWNSSFFAKPAKVGSKTPWHQDGQYWPIRPLATCSVWVAIDASTPENGCLQVIPGSHKRRELGEHEFNSAKGLSLPLELKPDAYDESTARNIELAPGQISLHDVFLAHGSEPNRSDKPRRGMTLRYMPTTSVYQRDIDQRRNGVLSMSERTLFLMRGIDRSGGNDFRLRH